MSKQSRISKPPVAYAGPGPAIAAVVRQGSCTRCNRALRDPASVARGMGKTCARKAANDLNIPLPLGAV